MAEQPDLPSDSDDSDVDFKPSDEESLPSEEDSDGSVEEAPPENEDQSNPKRGKRKKKQLKQRKKMKKKENENDDENDKDEKSEETKILTAEEEKKRADSLWNELMNDCGQPARKTTSIPEPEKQSQETNEAKSSSVQPPAVEKENKAVVTEVYEFAGEKVIVQKEVPAQHSGRGRGLPISRGRGRGRGGGGLASLIGQLGKKNKLSTLEKSKLDWENFKKDKGIEEDLERHNKGKEGYLEKQDFLQRTDFRQFEIEKQLRTTSRSNR